ncbi:hypothetical protein Scep_023964 [Stephania cephalantha]|uniref:Uncharacterized protein n=1 Tax=Stephania cephalantha TaxID=152367 RepID=A0AAP0EW72_9MAGN
MRKKNRGEREEEGDHREGEKMVEIGEEKRSEARDSGGSQRKHRRTTAGAAPAIGRGRDRLEIDAETRAALELVPARGPAADDGGAGRQWRRSRRAAA